MYAGHFAVGMVLKSRVPAAPTWGLLVGIGVLDILFGPFVLLGIERVSLTPDAAPGFSLDHIDWSHSFMMAAVWSALYGALFLKRGKNVAIVMGVAVFSHFVLDLVMHPPDLALWPGSGIHMGFGLWTLIPVGWWFVELLFVGLCLAYYHKHARQSALFGGRPWGVVTTIVVLHVLNSPWLATLY